MKIKYFVLFFSMLFFQNVFACPVCDKQQPTITRGLTHGAGPESNWDWVIIFSIMAIALLTFIFSIKYMIWPGEKNKNHIKQSVLNY